MSSCFVPCCHTATRQGHAEILSRFSSVKGMFSELLEMGRLSLNRTSDQLSPRTPPAIFSSPVAEDSSADATGTEHPAPAISSFSNCGD
jgi:hypothetical protein